MNDLRQDAGHSPGIDEQCIKPNSGKKIVLKEKQTRFVVINENSAPVYKAEVGGCLMSEEEGKKCDFLVNQKETAAVLLVELKGNDISGAREQLEASEKFFSKHLPDVYKYTHILVYKKPSKIRRQKLKKSHPRIKMYTSGKEEKLAKLINL